MASASSSGGGSSEKFDAGTDELIDFLDTYYRDEVMTLAQRYPKDQRSLHVEFSTLSTWDYDFADTYLSHPGTGQELLEEALRQYDLPVDITLSQATVRLTGLDETDTFYPGEFSPTHRMNEQPFLAVEGEIEKATDVNPEIVEAAFECQRCGTMTYIPQSGSGFQEPHECQGCERQGPFRVNNTESQFIDHQKLRVIEPPERAPSGDGSEIDVNIRGDICESAQPGDSVVISGTLRLEQQTNGNTKKTIFDHYLDGESVVTTDTDYEDLHITEGDRDRAHELSQQDIFALARESIAVGLAGDPHPVIKEAVFLGMVGGVRVEFDDGTSKRGDFHIFLIGDPSTGKSTYFEAIRNIAPRSYSASGKGASAAGLTGAAVRDEFGDSQWSIEGGALVKAHKGVATIDEFDKMDAEAASSMNDALEKQEIPVSKAGINATLKAETTVVAAANPKHTRWNDYDNTAEQIDFDGALLSRFGLVFKLQDRPEEERDRMVGTSVVAQKEMAKARNAGDGDEWSDDMDDTPAIEHDFLQKYIAIAKRQPEPRFRPPEDRTGTVEEFAGLVDSYVSLRGSNGYDDDQPVPVSSRKLEDMHRIAEASARARLSEWIEAEDVKRAKRLIGESLRQYGQDEEGNFDSDITETGTSKNQKDREKVIEEILTEEEDEYDHPGVPEEDVVEMAAERGLDESQTESTLHKLDKRKGWIYQPKMDGNYVWLGRGR